MNSRIPKNLPTWAQMCDSLDDARPATLAKLLGVTERTIWNYHRAEQAPRAVMLALFWLTPWGDSALNTDRENLVRVLQSLTKSLENQVAGLRQRIAYLEGIGGFGSANEPVQVPEMAPQVRQVR